MVDSMKQQKYTNDINKIDEIFNFNRRMTDSDYFQKCPLLWDYKNTNGKIFLSYMYYIRSFKNQIVNLDGNNINLPKGMGEKLISYYMILWLVKNHKTEFNNNYETFIKHIGYYKDCLIISKMAIDRKFTLDEIRSLLMPMASALMEDEYKIVNKYLSGSRKDITLSMASKWAPREGKAYSCLIPFLKQLCNITGKKTNMKWRKYIQQISRFHKIKTIDFLLSSKKYDMVEFNKIPPKAFNMYKYSLLRNTKISDKFIKYMSKIKNTSNIISKYGLLDIFLTNDASDYKLKVWDDYINSIKTTHNIVNNYIPVIDVSGGMFINNSLPIKVAIILSNILCELNTDVFHQKVITYDINTKILDMFEKNIFNKIDDILNSGDLYEDGTINIFSIFHEILDYIIRNNYNRDKFKLTNVFIMSNNESICKNIQNIKMLSELYQTFNMCGYSLPNIICWNICDMELVFNKIENNYTNLTYVCGYQKNMIESFIESSEISKQSTFLHNVKKYINIIV